MEEEITRENETRRRYSAEFKAQLLRECNEPGASVAGTALAHGINANLVHKWRRNASRAAATRVTGTAPEGFIPLALQRPLQAAAQPNLGVRSGPSESIEISVQRGAVRARILWPAGAAGDCAAWLAELIR